MKSEKISCQPDMKVAESRDSIHTNQGKPRRRGLPVVKTTYQLSKRLTSSPNVIHIKLRTYSLTSSSPATASFYQSRNKDCASDKSVSSSSSSVFHTLSPRAGGSGRRGTFAAQRNHGCRSISCIVARCEGGT
jgi:hypothetical protein